MTVVGWVTDRGVKSSDLTPLVLVRLRVLPALGQLPKQPGSGKHTRPSAGRDEIVWPLMAGETGGRQAREVENVDKGGQGREDG